jgi:hypothetical protein
MNIMVLPVMLDMEDGQEQELPCGVRVLCVAPKNAESTFDLIYSESGEGIYGVKVPFTYDYAQPLRSPRANPLKIVAHGQVHLFYTT